MKMIMMTGVRTLSSWLWVHQPSAAILGSREKHVDLGDSVSTHLDDNDYSHQDKIDDDDDDGGEANVKGEEA